MKTIIYSRVSTDKQSCDSQLSELREYAVRKGWVAQEITDTISGSKTSRQGLDELMKLVRSNKVAHVLAFRLDRLGRSTQHLAQLFGEFHDHGVAVIVPGQGIDTSTDNPTAALQRHMLMAFAQFERDLIRERVNAGLRAAKARGVRLGRKPLDQVVKLKIAEALHRGHGTSETARLLNMPKSTVQDVKTSMKGMAA